MIRAIIALAMYQDMKLHSSLKISLMLRETIELQAKAMAFTTTNSKNSSRYSHKGTKFMTLISTSRLSKMKIITTPNSKIKNHSSPPFSHLITYKE